MITGVVFFFFVQTDSSDHEDEGDVPMAQRKKFTRVEMARVLMERNQVINWEILLTERLTKFNSFPAIISTRNVSWNYKKPSVGPK